MKRWSTLLGALGAVGVAFSLLSFVLTLFFGPFLDRSWMWSNFAAGALLCAVAVVMNIDLLRDSFRGRRAQRVGRGAAGSLLTTLLGIVILACIGFLLERHSLRFDWSEQEANTLSEQTLGVLTKLPADVEVVAFYAHLGGARSARELLDRYRYETDRIDLRFVDPAERPDLVERYEIPAGALGSGGLVHIRSGDRSLNLTGLVDALPREPGDDRPDLTEEELTNALLRLISDPEKTIYFLEGHGERAVEGDAAQASDGFFAAAEALRGENVRVGRLLILATGGVPEDADVLILPGPTRELAPEEHAILDAFVARGGSILALVDPRVDSDLPEILARWGVELGDDIVLDQKQAVAERIATPLAMLYGDHEITRNLGEATIFHVARSVRPNEAAADRFLEIVYTSEDSWAERDLARFLGEGRFGRDETDLAGPVPIAIAGTVEFEAEGGALDGRGRLVVFGDADFASNQLLGLVKNRDLFLNAVHWLADSSDRITIRPVSRRASRFRPTQAQMNRVRFLSLFVFPELLAVAGVLMWWTRRAPRR